MSLQLFISLCIYTLCGDRHAINFVQSDEPLNTPIPHDPRYQEVYEGCPCVSAGDHRHEWTSGCAIDPVFVFLDKSLAQASR
jgi:hypothetical protein